MKTRIYITLLALSFAIPLLWGQAVATLGENELLMGNTTRLEVKVPVPDDSTKVEFPLIQNAKREKRRYIPLVSDSVELLVRHKAVLESSSDGTYVKFDLYLQSFDSGRYEIPPLMFLVEGEKIYSNPVKLDVIPVKVKADDKIDDFTTVAEPFEINPEIDTEAQERNLNALWWILISLLLLAFGVVLFYLFWRNGKFSIARKKMLPYQVALLRLSKLKKMNLPHKGKTKEYYTGLSDIIRVYLKKEFGIKTYEKTSAEILLQISDKEETAPYSDVLRKIFEASDLVKFAKLNPTEAENSMCMEEAVRFVEMSHPVESEKD